MRLEPQRCRDGYRCLGVVLISVERTLDIAERVVLAYQPQRRTVGAGRRIPTRNKGRLEVGDSGLYSEALGAQNLHESGDRGEFLPTHFRIFPDVV